MLKFNIAIIFLLITFLSPSTFSKDKLVGMTLNINRTSKGTAFKLIYNNKIYLVSAEHVCKDYSHLIVNRYLTNILLTDKDNDLCILNAKTVNHLLPLGIYRKSVSAFDKVKAVGYPSGYNTHPVMTDGRIIGEMIISLMYPEGPRRISTVGITARIFPGNSGGPVLIGKKVVGVIIAGGTRTNFGHYVPIKKVIQLIKRYEESIK